MKGKTHLALPPSIVARLPIPTDKNHQYSRISSTSPKHSQPPPISQKHRARRKSQSKELSIAPRSNTMLSTA
ncbi:hypothetical protein M3J09_010315 [Ascochyta lentis]